MKITSFLYVVLLVAGAFMFSCKKTSKGNASSKERAGIDSGMVGVRTWTGKKIFLKYDTSTASVHWDSVDLTISMAIIVLSDSIIVDTSNYAYLSPDTLRYLSSDTFAKVVSFTSVKYFGGGSFFGSIYDSIAYDYLSNTILWYENSNNSVNSYKYVLHTP